MVYGRYNELVNVVYKPTNITGGPHNVHYSTLHGQFRTYHSHIMVNVIISGFTHWKWWIYPLKIAYL